MRPEVLAGIERELRQQAESEGIAHFVVGVAVFRGGKLLVVRRVEGSHQGMWELPGGVEPGSPSPTAWRASCSRRPRCG